MKMNARFLKFYMDVAERCAEMSYANRLKVGGIIVKNDDIISHSWNGTPRGWRNQCEDENNVTLPEVVHCEENLIAKVAKAGHSCDGAMMFLTHAPCVRCAHVILQAGIKNICYKHLYASTTSNGEEGAFFLRAGAVYVEDYNYWMELTDE